MKNASDIAKGLELKAALRARAVAPQQVESLQFEMPFWQHNVRGMPNSIARSALFNVNKPAAPREKFDSWREIASSAPSRTTISVKGDELRQDDADIFLEILHLTRDKPVAPEQTEFIVSFSAYAMLKTLEWDLGGKGYQRLKTIIDRLEGINLQVKTISPSGQGIEFKGRLINSTVRRDARAGCVDGKTHWEAYVNVRVANLFSQDDYSRIGSEQRRSLRSELAKWLHSYYHTHAVPFAHKVEFIHRHCGSQAKALSHFRVTLKKALTELKNAGFLSDWRIDGNDMVHVVRTSTPRIN